MAAPTASVPNAPAFTLSVRWRLAISALLLTHIFIVGLFPFTAPPASTFARWVYSSSIIRHYPEVLYMDHGYKFFAPNPGVESRQIRWTMTTLKGEQRNGIYPHKDENWPRLMYHRHFMLAEHIPFFSDDFIASYARHLLLEHDGEQVELFERKTLVPRLEAAQDGMELTDPSLIREQSLGKFSRSDYAAIEEDSLLVGQQAKGRASPTPTAPTQTSP